MLAKLAAPIYPASESRRRELEDLGVPQALIAICTRPDVWRRAWANVMIATHDRQEVSQIASLDWIEYLP